MGKLFLDKHGDIIIKSGGNSWDDKLLLKGVSLSGSKEAVANSKELIKRWNAMQWMSLNDDEPSVGQYVQLFSNGVVQNINPMFDSCEDGYFWNFHDLLDEDPYVKDGDMWMPLPEGPQDNKE